MVIAEQPITQYSNIKTALNAAYYLDTPPNLPGMPFKLKKKQDFTKAQYLGKLCGTINRQLIKPLYLKKMKLILLLALLVALISSLTMHAHWHRHRHHRPHKHHWQKPRWNWNWNHGHGHGHGYGDDGKEGNQGNQEVGQGSQETTVNEESGYQEDDKNHAALSSKWTLKFEHACRQGVSADSNRFKVEFNGQLVKDFNTADYEIHQEKFIVKSISGKNKLSFIGEGKSDGLGQTVSSIQLRRRSWCGWDSAIVNGNFDQGHQLGHGWRIFGNSKIPGWNTADGELEIGWGRIYNSKWSDKKYVCELDANRNSHVYQEFQLDNKNRLPDVQSE